MQRGFIPILFILIIGVLSVGIVGGVYYYSLQKDKKINSFEECAKVGNPIQESSPRICRTKDGRQFIEDLKQEAIKVDEFQG